MPTPTVLLRRKHCLYDVSKDLQGHVETVDVTYKTCGNPPCDTMTIGQRLELTTQPGPCDSPISSLLEGSIGIRLITTFSLPNERSRGVHAADLGWLPGGGGNVSGTLHGITNAGVVRGPHFKDCENCLTEGVLTGLMSGRSSGIPGISTLPFDVEGVYRFAYDPSHTIGNTTPVIGTLEGQVIVPCSGSRAPA